MYKDIIGPDKQNTDITHAMIWVLPKSSNIGTGAFFHVYNMLLEGIEPKDYELMHVPKSLKEFNKEHFVVGHAEFPGLKKLEKDPKKLQLWNSLSYTQFLRWEPNGPIRETIVSKISEADVSFLEHCRVVFIFRNPLDQMLSYYKHYNHLPPDDQTIPNLKPSNTLEDSIFNHGISNYIKMFYTFHVARETYPDHILFIPYEKLMSDRRYSLLRIIKHLDLPFDEPAFNRALELTSMENLKRIENTFGRSLIRDPHKESRHIRNGGIGVWQSQMNRDMVQRIENEFNRLGLSLKMFHLTDVLEPEFNFLEYSELTTDKKPSKNKLTP